MSILCYAFKMVKILGLDIPVGLEDAWAKFFQFTNKTTADNFILKTAVPTRAKKSAWALRSLFVKWQTVYDALSQETRDKWQYYWSWLPFTSYTGSRGFPGSGYSAFVYLNAPRYKAHLSLQTIPPYGGYFLGVYPFSLTGGGAWGYASFPRIAQQYIPPVNQTLVSVAFALFKQNGAPTDNVILNIYDGGATPESGTLVAGPIAKPMSPMAYFYYQGTPTFFDLVSSITLLAGHTYYFVLTRSGILDLLNSPGIASGGKPDTHLTSAVSYLWYHDLFAWNAQTVSDWGFYLYN